MEKTNYVEILSLEFFNTKNNNLDINAMENITEILKRKIDKQINKFVSNK